MRRFIAALALVACTHTPPGDKVFWAGRSAKTVYQFTLDPKFTPSERDSLRAALATWAEYADGNVGFYVRTGTPCNVTATPSTDPVIVDSDTQLQAESPGAKTLGAVENTKPHVMHMVIDRLRTYPKAEFYRVALHEFGHMMDLEHTADTRSVMYKFRTDSSSNCPLRADMIAFCHAQHCMESSISWCTPPQPDILLDPRP